MTDPNSRYRYLAIGTLFFIAASSISLHLSDWQHSDVARSDWITFAIFLVFSAALFLSTAYIYTAVRQDEIRSRYFHALLQNLPSGIVIFDENAKLAVFSSRYEALYGINPGELRIGMHQQDLIALRRRAGLPVLGDYASQRKTYAEGGKDYFVEQWEMPDGRTIRMSRLMMEDGGFIAKHEDITDEIRMNREILQTKQFLDTIIENIPSGILVKDPDNLRYVLFNRAAERILGIEKQSVIGKCSHEIYNKELADSISLHDRAALAKPNEQIHVGETVFRTSNDELRTIQTHQIAPHDGNGPAYLLTVLNDVTQLRCHEKKIMHMAMNDALTGLKNRAWFNEKLSSLDSPEADDLSIALILIDLDGFKEINDTFGHAAGDSTLKIVAAKLTDHFGAVAEISRLGGDEFALFVEYDVKDDVIKRLSPLLSAIGKPMDVGNHKVSISCSAGIAFTYNGHLNSADDLYSQADAALYEAKGLGKATFCEFTPEIGIKKLKSKAMEMGLRQAITLDQFEVYYQPIVESVSDKIVSMEALLRWIDPIQGMISPEEFIPLAEETGLIVTIGEIVLSKACNAAVKWPDHVCVSVNISPVQFRDLNLAEKIADILKNSGLPAHRLELEITEATLLTDDSCSLYTLNKLRDTGVRIVMDDFGTGYSSLNYIRNFPFDKIKIDKSYIDDMSDKSNKSNVILHSVLAMARHLDLRTTAEGVETLEQSNSLRRAGCSELQGYLFGRPMPEHVVAEFWKSRSSA